MLAYFIMAYRTVKKYEEQTLSAYIRGIIYAVEEIEQKDILTMIDTNLIADFPFAHSINNEELSCYGLKVFYILLKSNRDITEKDIILQTEIIMRFFSARTIIIEAHKLSHNLIE